MCAASTPCASRCEPLLRPHSSEFPLSPYLDNIALFSAALDLPPLSPSPSPQLTRWRGYKTRATPAFCHCFSSSTLQSASSNLRAPKLWTTALLLSHTQRDRSAYHRSTSQAVAHLFETHHQQTAKDASAVAIMVQWTSEKDAVVSSHSTIHDIPPTDHLLSSWSASSSMPMSRSALNSGTTPRA